jgi:hypothetical protein
MPGSGLCAPAAASARRLYGGGAVGSGGGETAATTVGRADLRCGRARVEAFRTIAPDFVRVVGRMRPASSSRVRQAPPRVMLSADNPDSIAASAFTGL